MTRTVQTPADDLITAEKNRRPLNAADRCDTCGAPAYVAAVVREVELLYCGHHANRYEQRLRAVAESWHDERAKLHTRQQAYKRKAQNA